MLYKLGNEINDGESVGGKKTYLPNKSKGLYSPGNDIWVKGSLGDQRVDIGSE